MSEAELLETGELEPVNAICVRRLGKRISPATTWRWIRTGVRGGVKLAAIFACGCWCTTEAAFVEFLRRQTAERTAGNAEDRVHPTTEGRS